MAFDKPGHRVRLTASRQHVSGTPCVEENHAGWAEKVQQLDRFVKPDAAAVTQIPSGEEFVIVVGGEHELPLVGGLSGVAVGDRLYINDAAGDPVVTSQGAGGTNEVQTLTITATGGTYTLEFDGEVTDALAFNASAATIQSALEGLSNISPGDVTVAGTGGSRTLTFGGDYAGEDVPAVVVDDSAATGGTVTNATTTPGVAAGGSYPLGAVRQIDDSRTPAVARVNTNAWQAFLQRA